MQETQTPQAAQTSQNSSKRLIIILLAVIIALLGTVVAILMMKDDGPAQSVDPSKGLQYATQGVTALDQDSLQAAIDDMAKQAQESMMPLEYKNIAISSDGKVFDCYIGNPASSAYDMYIAIYGDMKMTDELFLSGLIRPGEKFESIELNRALEPGAHTVYCAFTTVEEDHETIHAQTIVTIDFQVDG